MVNGKTDRSNQEHDFVAWCRPDGVRELYTHLKLTIMPDGGVKRFRAFGTTGRTA